MSHPALRTHIIRCVENGEHNLQRKAIRRRWQLWKGYDRLGEMVMATWMREHSYCEMSGEIPTMGCQAAAVRGMIAVRGGTVVVAEAAVG